MLIADENNIEMENRFVGATYDAYVYTRANFSEEGFKQVQEENIFASTIYYDTYKKIWESFISSDEFDEKMVGDDEEGMYDTFAAKLLQYLTSEGSIE